MEGSTKRVRVEETNESMIELLQLLRDTLTELTRVERYLDGVPVCRHTLITRRLPVGMRDNGEFITECVRCGKLL